MHLSSPEIHIHAPKNYNIARSNTPSHIENIYPHKKSYPGSYTSTHPKANSFPYYERANPKTNFCTHSHPNFSSHTNSNVVSYSNSNSATYSCTDIQAYS